MRLVVGAWLLGAVLAVPLAAQDGGGQISIVLPLGASSEADGPAVAATSLLRDAHTRELLRSGFPTAVHYKLELWREDRWFDHLEGATEWDVFVAYEAVDQVYQVDRVHGRVKESLGSFGSVTSAEQVIDKGYRVPFHPMARGKQYYYALTVDVQTMTLKDLDALQRWLNGDFGPAVRGRSNPATAVTDGLATLLSRVLGADKRHLYERSKPFRAGA